MRVAIADKGEELGLTLEKRRSRRYPAKYQTDADFADDIALLSNDIQSAQELLTRVEISAKEVGLTINASKTETMSYNVDRTPLETISGDSIKIVNNFKYLESWLESTEKDILVRKARAWQSCHKMKKIWKSDLKHHLKVRLFVATVESVLLYGCETWKHL